MKVEQINSVGPVVGREKPEQNKAAPIVKSYPGISVADSVTLSQISRQLKAMGKLNIDDGPFDSERVKTIKQAIKDGVFTIDSDKIADEILDASKHLVNKKR